MHSYTVEGDDHSVLYSKAYAACYSMRLVCVYLYYPTAAPGLCDPFWGRPSSILSLVTSRSSESSTTGFLLLDPSRFRVNCRALAPPGASTTTVSSSPKSFLKRPLANVVSSSRWTARFTGLAPYAGSYPRSYTRCIIHRSCIYLKFHVIDHLCWL